MASYPDYDGAKNYALSRLESLLSPSLSYHSVYHTRDDVLPAATRIARYEGICEEDLLLLQTAVVFHDIGFTVQVADHEIISAEIVSEVLPAFGYRPEQVQKVKGMVLVTKLFTPPQNILEAIMVDADLDVLGRDDFFKRNNDLRAEITNLGKQLPDEQWYAQQLAFLQVHRYRTISAQAIRNPLKKHNQNILSGLLQNSILSREGLNGRLKSS